MVALVLQALGLELEARELAFGRTIDVETQPLVGVRELAAELLLHVGPSGVGEAGPSTPSGDAGGVFPTE